MRRACEEIEVEADAADCKGTIDGNDCVPWLALHENRYVLSDELSKAGNA